MKLLYLDLCCFNRPFDDQNQMRIHVETEAKLLIQQGIKEGRYGLVWSYMLLYENSANPDPDVGASIGLWEDLAKVAIGPDSAIPARTISLQEMGLGVKDSLHLACAIQAEADYFLTVDKGILKRAGKIGDIMVMSPLEFIEQED